jgi:phosphate transport system substrate-binding protein
MASRKLKYKGAIVAVLVLIAAAMFSGCLSDGNGGNGEKPKLTQTGSSTVLPLAIGWAEEFDDADITVSGGGSSHGLNALLNKEADLGDASRLMKGKDYEKVNGDGDLVKDDGTATGPAPTGVWPHKWVVAYDVLAVVVNKQNGWATELNFSQLYEIFTDDDPAIYWDEVSGLNNAPHEKIEIYAPDEASGTYDFFFEKVIPKWGKDDQQAGTRLESDEDPKVYHPNADDNVILQAIKDNKYAIGYFGFAYLVENPGVLKVVAVAEADETPVEASLANVASYPMARPLHIYTDGIPKEGSIINKYLTFVFSDEGQDIVALVGYVRLSLVDPSLVTSQKAKL